MKIIVLFILLIGIILLVSGYLESELNNLMGEYKKNEINRDIFYEEQKREKLKDAAKKLRDHEQENAIEDKLDEPDPWMNSRFKNAPAATEGDATEGDATEVDATEVDATTEATDSTEESKIKTI